MRYHRYRKSRRTGDKRLIAALSLFSCVLTSDSVEAHQFDNANAIDTKTSQRVQVPEIVLRHDIEEEPTSSGEPPSLLLPPDDDLLALAVELEELCVCDPRAEGVYDVVEAALGGTVLFTTATLVVVAAALTLVKAMTVVDETEMEDELGAALRIGNVTMVELGVLVTDVEVSAAGINVFSPPFCVVV